MPQKLINVGSVQSDGIYDSDRTFATKVNENFAEIYSNSELNPAPQSNGFLVGNGRQKIGRSLIPGPGVVIENPAGISGNPIISAQPGIVLLTSKIGADLNVTTDQQMQVTEYLRYIVTQIIVTNRSATPTAAAGGVYTAASKGGYALISASQAYSALTDEGLALVLAPAMNRVLTGPNLYLSLMTANGAACTVDVYVFGLWLP